MPAATKVRRHSPIVVAMGDAADAVMGTIYPIFRPEFEIEGFRGGVTPETLAAAVALMLRWSEGEDRQGVWVRDREVEDYRGPMNYAWVVDDRWILDTDDDVQLVKLSEIVDWKSD